MAAADMDTLQHSQQRYGHSWSHNADFHNTINKLNLTHQTTASAITKGGGCGYDVVSMEMDDTSPLDLFGLHSHSHGRSLHAHSAAGVPGNGLAPGQSMMVPSFMHHSMGKGISIRKYPCKMCSQVFDSKTEYQMHVQSHMREPKPYKCSQCTKSFANSSYLSQHMRIHLGIKPYQCDICKKKFTQLSHLQQHIRTHTGDKPYRCQHQGCNKAFSQLSNLQSHSRCHQTDKPHKCNSCYKCFTDEISLQEHIPKHRDSKHLKTHICSYCGKSYTQETYLARHMAKHSDKMDKQRCAAAAALAHAKATGEIYWPKQESGMDLGGSHTRLTQEDLYNPTGYNPYAGTYPNAHMGQYGTPTGYDMASRNSVSSSAFSALNASRSGLYYQDPLSFNAMKTHNVNGLPEGKINGSANHQGADHFQPFTNAHAQAMRNFANFNGMPTMLPDSSQRNGSAHKELLKQQRF